MKQTAVKWLEERFYFTKGQLIDIDFEQAKEMEEQEKIDFADKYGTYLLQGGTMSAGTYNETFKSE